MRLKLLALALVALALEPGEAQFYHFGKNKVQYAEFEWQKMETPHFDVYFFAAEEELAGYAAHMAEQAYYDLENKFGHTVQRRIPLVVYASHIYFQQTNIIPNLLPEGVGGFTEYLKGRVVLPLSGSLPDFERVLHHELVHVFTFDRIRHVLKRRGISQFRSAPLWFSEGLAEYWSGPWDSHGDMVLRDALFSRRLVSIAQMYYIYGTYQMYKEGESICAFMAGQYGEDVFERLLTNWWRAEDFAQVFEITTGEPLSKLDKDWQYHLRKNYLPDISGSDPPSQAAKALTLDGFNVKPEVVAAGDDSGHVVFYRNFQGYTHIARVPIDGGDPTVEMEGERSTTFESLHPLDTKPAVSADGRYMAFAAKSTGQDHLYIWDMREKRLANDFEFADIVAISTPTWSPDGEHLAFSGADRGGLADIYTFEVASETLEQLTRDIYHDRDPDWSPDGGRLVFSSDRWQGGREGKYNLFIYHLEGGDIRPLSRGAHDDLQPSWSPDGKWVAYCSDRDTMYNLYATRLDTVDGEVVSRTRRLTHTLTGAFDPVWLPDQQGLLFSGYEKGRFHIYRMELPEAAGSSLVSQVVPEADELWTLEGYHSRSLFARQSYRKKLSLDVAQSQISQDPEFGTSGGIQIGLSDVLGNDQYFFVLSHIAGSQTGFFEGLNVAIARRRLERQVNVTWGAFRLNDRFSSRFGRFVREKRTGAYMELSYPFSMYDRVETRVTLRHADIDREVEGRKLKGWLIGNYFSYTHDNSLWIATGPLEGNRYSLGLAQTVDFKASRRFNVTLFGDYRHYVRLSRRSAYAVRLMGRRSFGDVPEFFSIGGSWTLRGYPWRSLWGSKMVLINNELRFPLLDRILIGLPFGNIDLSAFRGALFVDAGNAWSGAFDEWRGSIGGGARLALGGGFVFRLDRSRRTDFKSIDNVTRWEFFFGWDY